MSGFNDLATVYPNIAAQWDGELNGNLTQNMVLPVSVCGGNAAMGMYGRRRCFPAQAKPSAAAGMRRKNKQPYKKRKYVHSNLI